MTATPEKNTGPAAIRLNRFLAQCGLGSRRACDEIIQNGRIFVNGRNVTELGTKISPADTVEYGGRHLTPVRRLEYWAYHKPAGVMVTKSDPQGRTTIFQALEKSGFACGHLNYVGRLDFASEGLLLLTNDGSLIHALTHPRYRIKKVYSVATGREISEAERRALCEGVESEGRILRAGAVEKDAAGGPCRYTVTLYEGKNRQIRRMFAALRCEIVRLRRTRFASVRLYDLAPGAVRPLTHKEVAALKSAGFYGKKQT
jgi:23S rRNA pseudouridine2605 synthase